MLQRGISFFFTDTSGTKATSPGLKAADEKTLQPFQAAAILKKMPLSEAWRFFIDGMQQKRKTASTMAKMEVIGHHPEELLNLKCSDFYKLYSTSASDIKNPSSLEKYIFSWPAFIKPMLMSVKDNFDLNITFKEAFVHDNGRGWTGFERNEKGYLFALCNALRYSLEKIDCLDVSYIQSLHYKATEGVRGLNLDIGKKEPLVHLDKFRDNNVTSLMFIFDKIKSWSQIDLTDAKAAFYILLKKIASGRYSYLSVELQDDDGNTSVISDKNVSLKSYHAWFEFASSHNTIQLSSKAPTEKTFDECIVQIIEQFESDMKVAAHDSSKKLEAIIIFIQELCWLHPFIDGQTRTFVMTLLNQLLLKHGFLPTVLTNPNQFEEFTTPRLVKEVTSGMKNVLRLCLREPIYGITTQELFSSCSSEEKSYFQNSIKELSAYFEPLPVVGVSPSIVQDEKSVCKIAIDDVVNLMFDLYNNKLLSDSLLINFIDITTRENAFTVGTNLLASSLKQSMTYFGSQIKDQASSGLPAIAAANNKIG